MRDRQILTTRAFKDLIRHCCLNTGGWLISGSKTIKLTVWLFIIKHYLINNYFIFSLQLEMFADHAQCRILRSAIYRGEAARVKLVKCGSCWHRKLTRFCVYVSGSTRRWFCWCFSGYFWLHYICSSAHLTCFVFCDDVPSCTLAKQRQSSRASVVLCVCTVVLFLVCSRRIIIMR